MEGLWDEVGSICCSASFLLLVLLLCSVYWLDSLHHLVVWVGIANFCSLVNVSYRTLDQDWNMPSRVLVPLPHNHEQHGERLPALKEITFLALCFCPPQIQEILILFIKTAITPWRLWQTLTTTVSWKTLVFVTPVECLKAGESSYNSHIHFISRCHSLSPYKKHIKVQLKGVWNIQGFAAEQHLIFDVLWNEMLWSPSGVWWWCSWVGIRRWSTSYDEDWRLLADWCRHFVKLTFIIAHAEGLEGVRYLSVHKTKVKRKASFVSVSKIRRSFHPWCALCFAVMSRQCGRSSFKFHPLLW